MHIHIYLLKVLRFLYRSVNPDEASVKKVKYF